MMDGSWDSDLDEDEFDCSPDEYENDSEPNETDSSSCSVTVDEEIMKEYVRKATPNNIIILDEIMNHRAFNRASNKYRTMWTHDENSEGPSCHLCSQAISSDIDLMTYDGVTYTVIFKDTFMDLWMEEWNDTVDTGELQCCYCLNFYHRKKCNLTTSLNTYYNFKINKNWCCPCCVPEFIPKVIKCASKNDQQAKSNEKLLLRLVKKLNRVLIVPSLVYNTVTFVTIVYIQHLTRNHLYEIG